MEKTYEPLIPGTLPEDLYQGMTAREATEQELWQGYPARIDGPRPSGCLAFDRFTLLLHRHMHTLTLEQMATELHVSGRDLSGMVRAITGIDIIEWRERYIVLALRELLARNDIKMEDICRQLGYSRNGLHRLMQRRNVEGRRW